MTGINPWKYQVLDSDGKFIEPGDYFLLRKGDALATSTLRSYASNALTILDLNRTGLITLHSWQKEHLTGLVGDVSELAAEWEMSSTLKLPD